MYLNGEFIGGCDILIQMHQSGDLIEKLQEAGVTSALLKNAVQNEKADDKTWNTFAH